MPGERKDERGRAKRTLAHDAGTDREYTTPARRESLEAESPPGTPAPGPGEDPRAKAVERHAAPGGQGRDLDVARELADRDLREEAAARREAGGPPEDER